MNTQNANHNAIVDTLLQEAYDSRVSDLKKSVRLSEEALKISRELSNDLLIAQSLSRLSLFKMILGLYEDSKEYGEEALLLFQQLGDQRGIADVKYNIAGIYYKTDNYHLGLIYLIDCLEIYRTLNDYHNQARVHKSLGTIYEYFRDEKSAILSYEKSIEAGKTVNDLNLISNALNPLSGIYLGQGNIEKADEVIEESIRMKTETGDVRGMAFALYGKAKVMVAKGQIDLAERTFREANKIHEKMGERLGRSMCYYKLGKLYLTQGAHEKAEEELKMALKLAEDYNIVIIKFKGNYLLYELYKKLGKPVEALQFLEAYVKEKEAVINTQTQKVIESYEAISTMERLQKEAQLNKERAEILKKKNRAEEASRVKQEFLSTMSHEIRTPLNAVTTITSLLVDKYGHTEDELISSLKFSANNLLRIINDILDFSKLEAGKVQLEFKSADIRKLLDNIRATYNSMAQEKGLDLLLKIDDRLGSHYELDQTKLSQILGNLISNAIKYTDAGNVEIDLILKEQGSEREQIEFLVKDTGIGITSEFLSEIFESFSQPRSYTTKKQGGSGLGLAIVKKLVELHGSNIYVETEAQAGSKFHFELSLKKGIRVAETDVPASPDFSGMHVLVAEDNQINAMVVLKLLKSWGLESDLAKNGLEAVLKSKSERYDCILMDIHMPELDGFSATQQIRTEENMNIATPVYALTADITANQRKVYEPYFSGFLLKPIEKEKLLNVLEKHKI